MSLRDLMHNRVTSTYRDDVDSGTSDFESEVLSEDEFAWDWVVANEFVAAFGLRFSRAVVIEAKYESGLLGTCRQMHHGGHLIRLRPSMRGNEAWRTLFHELGHAITPESVKDEHGEEFRAGVVRAHDMWREFLRATSGQTRERVVKMVTNYGFWRGRPIGFSEGVGAHKEPRTGNLEPEKQPPG